MLIKFSGCFAEAASNKSQLAVDKSCRDIGKLAVWSVTSAKPGNGVELLCDDRDDTYWQSDGSQPHLINIQFQKKVNGFHKLSQAGCFLQLWSPGL